MNENAPLWTLIANCALGMFLVSWMMLTLVPFLCGYKPLLPGMGEAFVAAVVWAGWNASAIFRMKP